MRVVVSLEVCFMILSLKRISLIDQSCCQHVLFRTGPPAWPAWPPNKKQHNVNNEKGDAVERTLLSTLAWHLPLTWHVWSPLLLQGTTRMKVQCSWEFADLVLVGKWRYVLYKRCQSVPRRRSGMTRINEVWPKHTKNSVQLNKKCVLCFKGE